MVVEEVVVVVVGGGCGCGCGGGGASIQSYPPPPTSNSTHQTKPVRLDSALGVPPPSAKLHVTPHHRSSEIETVGVPIKPWARAPSEWPSSNRAPSVGALELSIMQAQLDLTGLCTLADPNGRALSFTIENFASTDRAHADC